MELAQYLHLIGIHTKNIDYEKVNSPCHRCLV